MSGTSSSIPARGWRTWSLVPIALLVLGRFGLFYWPLRAVGLREANLWGLATLLRLALIGLALRLERGRWEDFFLTRRNLGPALRDGALLGAAFLPLGWLYAQLTLGEVAWLPRREWLPSFLAALVPSGLVEELEFRSLLMGVALRAGASAGLANLLVGLYFGPIYHNRYLLRGDFLTLSIVFVFGLVAGWLTLRRGSVVPAVVGHTAMDFLIFLFVGGRVTRL